FTQSERTLQFPETGDIRADLISQLDSFVRWLTKEGAAKPVSELVGTAQIDADLARAWSARYALPRRDLARRSSLPAQEEGQIGANAALDIIVNQLWGALHHRLLVPDVPFDEPTGPRSVDQAFYGAVPR